MSENRLKPELSIIVLGCNQAQKILRLLDSISTQTLLPEPTEVVYTDDASTDDTISQLRQKKYPYPIRIVENSTGKRNRAVARNRGAQAAAGEWLLFLDGDGELHTDFLKSLWQNRKDNTVNTTAVAVHTEADCPARRYEVLRSPAYRSQLTGKKTIRGYHLQSIAFMLPSALFTKVGMFDESFAGRSGEDIDLGIRLEAIGATLEVVHSAIFFHNHYRTIRELVDVKDKYAAQGIPRILKHDREIFRSARLSKMFRVTPPYTVKHPLLLKWLTTIDLDFWSQVAERGGFWWTGRTLIPFLCFVGTLRGFHRYLTTGEITEEDAG